jgi:ATP:corrinoid adenosyltransferase
VTPGVLVVYTGDGKGKTTAALGMAFRALGRRQPVGMIQFVKGGWKTGEGLLAATLPGLDFRTMGEGFTWEGDDPAVHARAARAAWEQAAAWLAAVAARRPEVTVVITGRGAPPALLEAADLVTEMRCLRHPFTKGVKAIAGVDY